MIIKKVNCNTVGDLLDALAEIAKDPELSDVLDSSIEAPCASFDGFKIVRRTLSDKSTVLTFELTEE